MRIRTYLTLMVVSILIPVAVFSGSALDTLLRAEREASYEILRETARASVLAVDRELSRAQGSLLALATSSDLHSGKLQAFYAQAATVNTDPRSWTVLIDARGQQLLNTTLPFGTPLPAPIELRRVRRALQTPGLQTSNLLPGPAAHQLVIGVGLAVEGELEGHSERMILSQIFTANYFERSFVALPDRPRWLIGLFDRDGRTIARNRAPFEGLIGNLPSREILAAIHANDQRVFRNRSRDGVDLYTVVARSGMSGWSIGVGVPVDEIETAARRAVKMTALGLLAGIALALGLAAFFGRQLIASVKQAAASASMLGRGETPPPVRASISELRTLHTAQVDAGRLLTQERQRRQQAERDREQLLRDEQHARLAAETANRAKDEFLAMLGHEIRNPLAAIGGAVGILRQGADTTSNARQALAVFDRQSTHLQHIVDDLLDVARVTTGKIALAPATVDLGAITRHCLDSLHAAGSLAGYRVGVAVASAWVDGDATRLEQIVNNLLGNALKYTPVGGTIDVTVNAVDGVATLAVRDSGIGISAELMPKIFDLFTQGPTQLDRAQGGLGIGLTLVRQLVEMHGGSIDARSDGVGRGALLRVRLPAVAAAAPVASRTQPPVVATTYRILLVEDNADAREMMAMMLGLEGHTVLEAADGAAAIALAGSSAPELAVIDIGLPGMSGLEVARTLRADPGTRTIGLIALTGYGQEGDRKAALAAGFDLHLVKPVNMALLYGALAQAAAARPAPGLDL